ncbi:hypothetical protein D3C87_1084230 [compost metagenome]
MRLSTAGILALADQAGFGFPASSKTALAPSAFSAKALMSPLLSAVWYSVVYLYWPCSVWNSLLLPDTATPASLPEPTMLLKALSSARRTSSPEYTL